MYADRQETSMPTIAVVLAGGLGTRLQPVLADQPKVLAPVAGRPFLDYLLAHLRNQGIRQIVLSIGYLSSQIKSYLGSGDRWGLRVSYVREKQPLGTAGALRKASQDLEEPFFGLNGDTLFLADFNKLWQAHRSNPGAASVCLKTAENPSQRGRVKLDQSRRITSFEEKAGDDSARQSRWLVNAGLYVLEPRALVEVALGKTASIERQVFPELARRGELYGQVQQAYFADIGTPESLATFEKDVLARTSALQVLLDALDKTPA
jgi:NDP-sugar pyrophosphorylase family protein